MPVMISTTPYSFRVGVTRKGYLRDNNQIDILPFVDKFTEYQWSKPLRRFVPYCKYRYLNQRTGMIYLPRYALDSFISAIALRGDGCVIKEIPPHTGKDVVIPLSQYAQDKDARQSLSIEFLTQHSSHIRGLSLQPGAGKTYVATKSIALMGKRAMIGAKGLVDQWLDSIFKFTQLEKEDVYVIQGFQSLAKLVKQIDSKIHPKIILYSIPTLRGWAVDNEAFTYFPDFDLLAELFDVGPRVTDEAHLNFHANLILDLRINSSPVIPLTATFSLTKHVGKHVFDGHYPPAIRFGNEFYKRYIHIYGYAISAGQDDVPRFAYAGANGYSHVMYENWLLERASNKLKYLTTRKYIPLIISHYISKRIPGWKLLVLCSTTEMCLWMKKYITSEIIESRNLNLTAELYVEGSSENVLTDYDIIVSTPQSAGTGRDIKKLQTVFCTVAVDSRPQNEQMAGRLREFKDVPEGYRDRVPEFVYVYNKSVPPHLNYQVGRADLFTTIGRAFHARDF